jgi:hypothetical protein
MRSLPCGFGEEAIYMSNIFDEAQALVQCKSCSWYRNCVLPIRVTEEDLRKQMESSMPGTSIPGMPYSMSQLLSSMATAAQNSLLEGCPIFIERLRSNPKLAERVKKLMLEWSQENEQEGLQPDRTDL